MSTPQQVPREAHPDEPLYPPYSISAETSAPQLPVGNSYPVSDTETIANYSTKLAEVRGDKATARTRESVPDSETLDRAAISELMKKAAPAPWSLPQHKRFDPYRNSLNSHMVDMMNAPKAFDPFHNSLYDDDDHEDDDTEMNAGPISNAIFTFTELTGREQTSRSIGSRKYVSRSNLKKPVGHHRSPEKLKILGRPKGNMKKATPNDATLEAEAGEGDAGEGDAGEGDAGEGDAGEGHAGEGDAGAGRNGLGGGKTTGSGNREEARDDVIPE